MAVVLSQPTILIFRLTTSQKESITDDQSLCEIVFASKMMSETGLKSWESYLCCNLQVLVPPTWHSACWHLCHSSLHWWILPLYPLCQGKLESQGEASSTSLGWERGGLAKSPPRAGAAPPSSMWFWPMPAKPPQILSMVQELLWAKCHSQQPTWICAVV